MSASDNDRIYYLAGEDVDSLAPHERAELDDLRNLLDDDSVWTEPPPELEDRVVTAISDEARIPDEARTSDAARISDAGRETSAHPAASAQGASGAEAAARPRSQQNARRQRQAYKPQRRFPTILLERPMYMAGALAGLVAVISVVTLLTTRGGNSAPSQLQFAMVVNGTGLAPGAHGSATLVKENSGWHITLQATGLPHLTNGRYYQAWLKNSAGVLVPVGTFNDAVNVTLWSGVPVTQFRTLTVTRQQANGNPASSGQRVLTGTVQNSG